MEIVFSQSCCRHFSSDITCWSVIVSSTLIRLFLWLTTNKKYYCKLLNQIVNFELIYIIFYNNNFLSYRKLKILFKIAIQKIYELCIVLSRENYKSDFLMTLQLKKSKAWGAKNSQLQQINFYNYYYLSVVWIYRGSSLFDVLTIATNIWTEGNFISLILYKLNELKLSS